MRRRVSPCQVGSFLLAIALGLLAASPFLMASGLPSETDAELHVYRIAELGESLRVGNLYPRWAPDFYHGYGYPIFNYYAPATYHLGSWIAELVSVPVLRSAKTLFLLALVAGAVGAFLLGRQYGGEGGGLLAAAAFAFAPYVILIDPHVRGDLAEVVSVACLPWLLWSWELLWSGHRRAVVLAACASLAVLLTHNLVGLAGLALVLAQCLWQWLALRRPPALVKRALLLGLAVIAASAFFWLPFLSEQNAVRLDVAGEGHFDYRENFIPLRDLVRWLPATDWGSAAPDAPMSAGGVQLVLVALGAAAALLPWMPGRRRRGFYAASCFFLFWLTTESSRLVWRWVPGLVYYQFPWRFLGIAAALSVPVIASIIPALQGSRASTVKRLAPAAVGVGILVLILQVMPALYVRPWESLPADTSPQQILAQELQGRWRGTTSTDDFIPAEVLMIPGPQESVLASYAQSQPDRVNRYSLPDGASVAVQPSLPWRNVYSVASPVAFVLRLYLFDFPGWHARVDGDPTAIERADPEGFVTLKVPAGEHLVEVSFEDTAVRTIGWTIATVGSIALGCLAATAADRRSGPGILPVVAQSDPWVWASVAIALSIALLTRSVAVDRPWFRYQSPPGDALRATHQLSANFSDQIELLGYDIVDYRQASGRKLEVAVYWTATQPLTQTYQSFVHLVDGHGNLVAQSDHLNPAGYPTNLWPTNRYILDRHKLALPRGIEPGAYKVVLGLYLLDTQTRLMVTDASSRPIDDSVTVSYQLARRW